MAIRTEISVSIVDSDLPPIRLSGRFAWALQQLVKAGDAGCTPLDTPGPRWSGYIFKLRKAGLSIETIHERHGAPFPGTHARYVLRSKVEVEEPVNAGAV